MPPLGLNEGKVQQLHAHFNSSSRPHSIDQRAELVLACVAGETNAAIAKRMGLPGLTVADGASAIRSWSWKGCAMSSDPDARSPARTTRWPR